MRRGGNRMLTKTITEFYRKKIMIATQSGRFTSYLSYLVFAFGLLMLKAGNTYGQQYYPVQVRSFIQSPSVYVEDYYNPDNFRVQVTLTDLMMPSLDVLLKVTIQSPSGGQFVSGQGVRLTLSGGLTYTLTTEDLKELLSSRNLPGLPSSLQEGTYVFNFSVFDAATMFPVSNPQTDFASAIVLLNDPPLLTSPANGEVLDPELSGQNYMFSWTPRSFSLNPQEQVRYRLVIARIPAGRNPYDAFLTNAFVINQPFEDIAFNSFFYSPDFLPLQPGATYAWQITAYEERLIGNVPEKVSMRFRNQGRSDVFTFTVKEHCPALFLRSPELRQHPQSGTNSVLLGWNYDPAHNLYEIRYRPAGSNQTWTVQQQSATELFLGSDQLVRGKTYEYTVACLCNTWQEPVFGGTFQLPGGECEAPYPVLVSSNDANGITLNWEPVAAAGSYKVTYTDLLSGQSSQTDDLQATTVTLPPLTAGGYTIRIDAVCGSTTAQGEELRLDYDEKHIAGSCPLPRPFTFLALRPEAGTVHHEARLSWPTLSIHESWQLTYWHKDSVDYPHTATAGSPELLVSYIADNEFYHYRLQYTCKGGKTVTTPNGGFRVDAVDGLTTVTPGTADCFPPAVHSAEARSESSARIDWQGVKGAEEYVVAYQPADGSGQEKTFITSAANARLTGLTPGIVYQYEIRCRCGGQYSIASVPGEFDLSQLYSNNKCDTIAQLAINQITETEIQLAWTWPQSVRSGYDAHTSYTIRYKENGQDWNQAYTIDYHPDQDMLAQYEAQSTFKKTIDQLSPGTTYDIEVRARCGTEAARTNDIISGTTKEPEAPDCSKGGSCDRTSLTPVEKLEAGDTIQIADYSVLLKTIEKDSRGDNLWKGTGLAEAPLIGFSEHVRFDVDFDSLFVNDQICVVGGRIDLNVNVQLLDEATREKIQDLMAKTGELIDKAREVSDAVGDGIKTAQEYGDKAFEYFHGGGDVGRVKSGGLGDIPVSGDVSGIVTHDGYFTIDGTQYPVERYPVLVKDQNGQVYTVDKGKSPVNIGHYDESLKGFQDSLASSDYIVTFSPSKKARYAFDVWQDAYLKSVAMVPHYLSLGGKYHSAKAILPAEVDPVTFDLSGGNKNKLVFVNRDGFVFKTDGNTLNLVGGPAKDAQEVLALYDDGTKKILAGALLLASYPRVEKKVVIVPVLPGRKITRDAKAIEEQLNKAYNPVGVHYIVEFDLSFAENRDWCENGNCDFATGGSGLLSNNYTGVEARVIDAYIEAKGADSLDEATAYLFAINITKAGKEDEALEGKMNFEKQFGFLYAFEGQSNVAIGRTLAHELGHGNYKLHHIFDGMYLGDAARTSDNLMSYSTRTDALALNKLQWDVIHDPGVTWGVFKKDRDQEHTGVFSFNFLDPSGRVFSSKTADYPDGKDIQIAMAIEYGPVLAFSYNDGKGILYEAQFENDKFLGYKSSDGIWFKQQFVGDDDPFVSVIVKSQDNLGQLVYKWKRLEGKSFDDPLSESLKIICDHCSSEEGNSSPQIGAYSKTSGFYKLQSQVFLWDYSQIASGNYINYKETGFVSSDLSKVKYESFEFGGQNVKLIKCEADKYDFSEFKYPSLSTRQISVPSSIKDQVKQCSTTIKSNSNISIVTKESYVIDYNVETQTFASRTLTPFDKIPTLTQVAGKNTNSFLVIQKEDNTYEFRVSNKAKEQLAVKYLNSKEPSAITKIGNFLTAYGEGLIFAGNEYHKAWNEIAELIGQATEEYVKVNLTDYKCPTITQYGEEHYTKYTLFLLLAKSGQNQSNKDDVSCAQGMGMWNGIASVPSDLVSGVAGISSVFSSDQWNKGSEWVTKYYNQPEKIDQIIDWTSKTYKGVKAKIADADDCEMAFYGGQLASIIVSAVLVPEGLPEKLTGMALKASGKLIGLTIKTVGNSIEYINKFGRKVLEIYPEGFKIKWKNQILDIKDEKLLEEVTNALDNDKISLNDAGELIIGDDALARKLDGFLGNGGKLALLGKLKDYQNLNKWVNLFDEASDLEKLSNIDDAFSGLTQAQLTSLNLAIKKGTTGDIRTGFGELLVKLSEGNTEVLSRISGGGWTSSLGKFAMDLENVTFRDAILGRIELVDAWQVVNIDETIRKSISDLEKISNYLKINPNSLDELKDGFYKATDKRKWVDDLDKVVNLVAFLKSSVLAKISKNSKYSLKLTDGELSQLASLGRELKLTEDEIEAFILAHCRRSEKAILNDMKEVMESIAKKNLNNDIGWKPGYSMLRAYKEAQNAMVNGSILDPSVYLTSAYINNHLKKFYGEATYFVNKYSHENYVLPLPKLGIADDNSLYITTASLSDDVVVIAGKDLSVYEKQLGYSSGYFTNGKEVWRINIKNPENFNLRIPTGSEIGANHWWHPGGFTSGGVIEAVTDLIPKEINGEKIVEIIPIH